MMHVFPNKVEFYITNVCNLNCEGCNRFNNYKFTGWQAWSDYEAIYQQWSKHIDLSAVVILGGEPLLNPTVVEWVRGLNRIFGCHVEVLTNGTRLLQVKGLYESMLLKSKIGAQNHIGVSLHNTNDFDSLRNTIKQFFGANPIQEFGSAIGKPCRWNSLYSAVDNNGVQVIMHLDNYFLTDSAIHLNSDGKFTLRNSNTEIAHSACVFARYKSYHFIKGKLYKCGPVALLPEFDEQYQLDISDADRSLLNQYQPLTIDNFETYSSEFLTNINNPIPQCKFCCQEADRKIIYATVKKSTAS